jgi:hypothetical protein
MRLPDSSTVVPLPPDMTSWLEIMRASYLWLARFYGYRCELSTAHSIQVRATANLDIAFNNAKKEASAGVAGFAVFSRWSFGISYLRQLPDFEAHISS